jgi:hypothetical protein
LENEFNFETFNDKIMEVSPPKNSKPNCNLGQIIQEIMSLPSPTLRGWEEGSLFPSLLPPLVVVCPKILKFS